MPSPYIEQLRQQFYASLGINEYTPISEADAPMLIDQWEQYLFSAAQQSGGAGYPSGYPGYPGTGGIYQPSPAPRTTFTAPSYLPPNQRGTYTPGQIYNVGGGTYVGPPAPGSAAGRTLTPTPARPGATPVTSTRPYSPAAPTTGRPVAAPVFSGGGTSGGVFTAPPPR